MYTIFEIADWFANQELMTHKKLQKLCWYAYSWYLYLNKKELFRADFEAWVHGPMNPQLYKEKEKYNLSYISSPNIKEEDVKFLENVYKEYGVYSGLNLVMQSKQELPWMNARKDVKSYENSKNICKHEDIIKEYNKRQNEQEGEKYGK